MKKNKSEYWNDRYLQKDTGWDIGYISTPLKTYFDQLTDKSVKILIPGSGNSYEGEFLFHQGFTHTHLIDVSEKAIANFKSRAPSFPEENLHLQDFFTHEQKYDLIIEQTFLSALPPSKRDQYVRKMHDLLQPKGKLVGLLFGIEFHQDHPPYGGKLADYRKLFTPYFNIQVLEMATNSIPSRQGTELFIILEKK